MRNYLKILLRGAGLAFLCLAVLAFSVESLDRAFLRPHGNYARSLRKFLKHKDQLEVLYMGQSDIADAILDDRLGSNEFNFAWGGETVIGTYYKLKTYVDTMPRLKYVVLALPLCSFTSARTDQIRVEHYMYHIHRRDLWDLYHLKGARVLGQAAISWISFFENRTLGTLAFRIQKARKYWKDNKDENNREGEDQPEPGVNARNKADRPARDWDVERETQRTIQAHWVNQNPFDPHLILYFKKLLKLADEKNVKVVLLTCPISGRYLALSAPYLTLDTLRARVLDQPEIRPLVYGHLNYLELFADHDEYFKNPDHLAPRGAALLTDQARADLRKLGVHLEESDKDLL